MVKPPPPEELRDIAEMLRRHRVHSDMTKLEVAKKAGISLSSYERIERGKHAPCLGTLVAILKAMEMRLTLP